MIDKKKQPKYYNISKEYLLMIFTEKELEINKYATRPFIGYEDSQILIYLPEQTVHNPKRYSLCYYFKDNENLLAIPNMLFVPSKYKFESNHWNNKPDMKKKLVEFNQNYKVIKHKVYLCLKLQKYDQKFKDSHKQISKSHEIYKVLEPSNKNKKNNSNDNSFSM